MCADSLPLDATMPCTPRLSQMRDAYRLTSSATSRWRLIYIQLWVGCHNQPELTQLSGFELAQLSRDHQGATAAGSANAVSEQSLPAPASTHQTLERMVAAFEKSRTTLRNMGRSARVAPLLLNQATQFYLTSRFGQTCWHGAVLVKASAGNGLPRSAGSHARMTLPGSEHTSRVCATKKKKPLGCTPKG